MLQNIRVVSGAWSSCCLRKDSNTTQKKPGKLTLVTETVGTFVVRFLEHCSCEVLLRKKWSCYVGQNLMSRMIRITCKLDDYTSMN